jgi:hypothetical protein
MHRYNVVILCNASVEHRHHVLYLLKNKAFAGNVRYIAGSVLSEDDLAKADVRNADACLLVCNKGCTSAEQELAKDRDTILGAISVKYFVDSARKPVPIFLQLLNTKSKSHVLWEALRGSRNVQAICLSEMKMALLARSCVCPGSLGLITNLLTSFDRPSEDYSSGEGWEKEYLYGGAYQIHTAEFGDSFEGFTSAIADTCFPL